MSPLRTHSAIPRGSRSVLGSVLTGAASCGSFLALTGLLAHGRWFGACILTVALLVGVTAGVRAITRSWWAPTVAGLVVAAFGLLVAYGGPPGRLQVLPSGASLHRLIALGHEASTLIDAGYVPLEPARPVEMLVVGGAVAVFLLADLLALGLGVPAWSGLVLVSLWLPAVGLGYPAHASALAWTALAYLLLLALSAAPATPSGTRTRRVGWTFAASAGIVVVSLAVGPLIAAAPGWASFDLPNFGTGPIGPLRLSDNLDLRESLGQRSNQVVLRYTVSGVANASPGATPTATADPTTTPTATAGVIAGPTTVPAPTAKPTPTTSAPTVDARLIGPLRAFTLQSFDGRRWGRTEATVLEPWEQGQLLASDPQMRGLAPDANAGTLAQVDVTIDALREQRLPISTFPRTVAIDGSWLYDESRDEVIGENNTSTNLTYAMTVQVPTITADSLRGATGTPLADPTGYLAVPPTDHLAEIRSLAQQITADAPGPYEQALALQMYFRDAHNFTYDTRVAPAQSDDAVWDFLGSRRGYCVQFATSMAMMARMLGIPARLGVGFLPGVVDSDGVYTVTGKQSHAWPELYFPGTGWVRFEPTPAIQAGAPPQWSDPFTSSTATPDRPDITTAPNSTSTAHATQSSGPALGAPRATSSTRPGVIGGAVGLVLMVLATGVVLMRRRTRRAEPLTAESAWARLRERLAPVGITWTDARTPRQVAADVRARVVELRGTPLAAEAALAMQGLTDALETDRYAPRPSTTGADELEAWIGQILTDVTQEHDEPSARDDGAGAVEP